MKIQHHKKEILISTIVLFTITFTYFLPKFYAYIIFGIDNYQAFPFYTKVILCHGVTLILCFLATFYLASFSIKKMFEMLGLNKGFASGFFIALTSATPLILGMLNLHGFNKGINFANIWFHGIHPGYYEEILFRGFFIGILVRYAKWNTFIAIFLSSLLFAFGHLYQAKTSLEALIIFSTAFGVAIGFYMFYKYSNWNLWLPLFLHSFMDTATTISNWHGNITMNLQDNIFRISTIVIAIYFIFRIQKKNKSANSTSII